MEIWEIILILGVGFIAGIINTLAAGGSLLTLPVLIFLGLPSAVANGTNRVAIIVQSVIATRAFYKGGHVDKKLSILLVIPGLIGSIIGANLAITITDQLFNQILAIMMVITVIFIVWNPKKSNSLDEETDYSITRKTFGVIVFFFIGVYSGFIQAGVGFFMIAALTAIFGLNLIKANGLKVLFSGAFIFLSFFVFVFNDQVNWILGLTLAIGNGLGAWVGSQIALTKGEKWIKAFLFVTVLFMAGQLLGLFDF